MMRPMPSPTDPDTVRDHFRKQARTCARMGSPFTADLLAYLAEALDPATPAGAAVLGWPGDPKDDALALRLAGGLHALVLSGADPALAAAYPGGAETSGDGAAALDAAVSAALDRHADFLIDFLESPPQTNEVGRSAILLGGFLTVAAETGRPIALLETGASGGLNLHWDAWRYRLAPPEAAAGEWGASDAPLTLEPDWQGPLPPLVAADVVARAGCDRNPIDPGDAQARLRLRSYVWADQAARLARLDAALAHAAASPVRVEKADAGPWLEAALAARPDGAATVVYHSIFWQYVAVPTQARLGAAIEAAGATATPQTPLAWLRMEPAPEAPRHAELRLTLWPGGAERRLAAVDYHGTWVAWGPAGEAIIAEAAAKRKRA
jgi:hypothetical protein